MTPKSLFFAAKAAVEEDFFADFRPESNHLDARAWALAIVLADHPKDLRLPLLAQHVRALAGEVPAEVAIVDLVRVGALCIKQGVVSPTEAALRKLRPEVLV